MYMFDRPRKARKLAGRLVEEVGSAGTEYATWELHIFLSSPYVSLHQQSVVSVRLLTALLKLYLIP